MKFKHYGRILAALLVLGGSVACVATPCAVITPVANPVYDTTLPACPLHKNAVPVATDGDFITSNWVVSQPVILQYCSGDQCGPPFKLDDVIPVMHWNPHLYAGGIPVGIGTNVLYAIQNSRPYVLQIQSGGAFDSTAPAHSITVK